MGRKVQPLHWDIEAREAAVRAMQSKSLSSRDPEAAALLAAQLVAEEEFDRQNGIKPFISGDYNPARAYTIACKEFGWTIKQCDETHYLAFFAMLRELNEINQEQQDHINGR
jgi:hypothetical protein